MCQMVVTGERCVFYSEVGRTARTHEEGQGGEGV